MGCGASTGHYSELAYEKFKHDAEDKEQMILRSFYRAISNSFSDCTEKDSSKRAQKGVDVYPIINQNHYCSDEEHKADAHKGMRTLEELISGVFGANVGGIKRDENAKISLEVWKELCDGLAKECKAYWDDQDRVGLIKRITEMSLKVGRPDTSWCKKVRCFCTFEVVKVEPKPGHAGGDKVVDGKFMFVKLQSNNEEGELTFPAKPVKESEWDTTPAVWINRQYGKSDESKEKLTLDVLEWEAGQWKPASQITVAPADAFDV